jgi:uncharacterized membrane protein YqaE (UPF0057 family)
MHEVRVTTPPEDTGSISALAFGAGIKGVTVIPVRQLRPEGEEPCDMLSIECGTPQATRFLNALFAAPWFRLDRHAVSTRELRAIAASYGVSEVTQPMPEPALDVLQDLWQLTHTTRSYYGRAAAGALLLADGMFHNNPVSIVVAALFLPFLSQLLAVGLGGWGRSWRLLRQGLWAVLVSVVLCLLAGALMAALQGGPMEYGGFRAPLPSLLFAGLIGITAGLCSADDTGRRYLIGVAAAVQCGVYPVWLGAGLVRGFAEPAAVVASRVGVFAANLLVIALCALLTYALVGLGSREAVALSGKLRH